MVNKATFICELRHTTLRFKLHARGKKQNKGTALLSSIGRIVSSLCAVLERNAYSNVSQIPRLHPDSFIEIDYAFRSIYHADDSPVQYLKFVRGNIIQTVR